MKVAGVKKVDVSFQQKQAVVQAEACDPEAMIAALSKVGYRAHVK
jgi:copper chaperone CopZ